MDLVIGGNALAFRRSVYVRAEFVAGNAAYCLDRKDTLSRHAISRAPFADRCRLDAEKVSQPLLRTNCGNGLVEGGLSRGLCVHTEIRPLLISDVNRANLIFLRALLGNA